METTTTSPTPATPAPAWEATPHVPVRLTEAAIAQVKEVIKAQGFEATSSPSAWCPRAAAGSATT